MLGIAYLKTPPTTYVLHYKAGRVKREGGGLSFLYYRPTSTVVLIPVGSADVPFVFSEVTADFQEVTIQGQLTYRIADPRKLAGLLDYSVDAAGRYRSEDPGKLEERLVHATQVLARDVIGKLSLRDALAASEALVREITAGLRAAEVLTMAGVEPLDVSILSIRPTPEMARALEAEAREQLQREADESIYARRNAAVEQERIIKESELETELAVEAKQREIRERKMAAEIAQSENQADVLSGIDIPEEDSDEVMDILLDLTQRETRNFGTVFAKNLVKELKLTTPMFKVPHQQAGFKVLEAPDVPSAMIELGFVSNADDEKLLLSDSWRDKTAGSVVQAIDDFFERKLAQRGGQ